MIDTTERQVADSLDRIRADHVNRYQWVANRCKDKRIVDAGCGVGYGSTILAEAGNEVMGFDRDTEAIDYAKKHWNHNPHIKYAAGDIYQVYPKEPSDAVVAFEVLEHLVDPDKALRQLRELGHVLYASVPNEVGFPFRGYRHHCKHYTPEAFRELLERNGWKVREMWGQEDAIAPVEKDLLDGRTLVVVADRVEVEEEEKPELATPEEILGGPVPESVAIVAMGNSRIHYHNALLTSWGKPPADEVWAINAMGGGIPWDRLFHQDDIKIQERRIEAGNEKLGNMLEWMRNEKERPIYTSRVDHLDGEYPTAQAYPIEWVLAKLHHAYMNNTVVYAVCLAIACGVKKILLYGCDFAYPQSWKREQGRGCLEFWIGVATEKGIEVELPAGTTLMDAHLSLPERLYGYDTEWINVQNVDGQTKISRVARKPEDVPTAEEIELRYSKDPNKQKATRDKEK